MPATRGGACCYSLIAATAVTFAALAPRADAAAKRFHECDGYFPAEVMPLSLYGVPVGEARALTIRLPEGFEPKDYSLTLLWILVDDVDAKKEARIFINGKGPFDPPDGTLGEGFGDDGLGRAGHVRIDSKLLKPGPNELKFVFADNLKGSTSGFDILDAMIVLPRTTGPVDNIPMIERELYIDVPGHPKLAIYNSSLDPRGAARRRDRDPVGWKPHDIRKGDGKGGWIWQKGELQFLHARYGKTIMPFGLTKMDNGELVLVATWDEGHRRIVLLFSKDNGDTWSDWHLVPIGHGRPMMLAALGGGRLTCVTGGRRYMSGDYGRTFRVEDWVKMPLAPNGSPIAQEGNAMVDYDADGSASLIMELGHNGGPPGKGKWPITPSHPFIRTSTDAGKTWATRPGPEQWRWTDTHNGKTYQRGVCEGSLTRAKNGWIVAAVRTDMPAEFFHTGHDHWEGTAVSISKDDGKTWSPLDVINRLGRMHPHLVTRPNGDVVMGYILRQDLRDDGSFASYGRGCEAIISRDNGQTWDKEHKYVLDAWPHVDPLQGPYTLVCGHTASVALDDGRIITCYGHYLSKGAVMIRWKP